MLLQTLLIFALLGDENCSTILAIVGGLWGLVFCWPLVVQKNLFRHHRIKCVLDKIGAKLIPILSTYKFCLHQWISSKIQMLKCINVQLRISFSAVWCLQTVKNFVERGIFCHHPTYFPPFIKNAFAHICLYTIF